MQNDLIAYMDQMSQLGTRANAQLNRDGQYKLLTQLSQVATKYLNRQQQFHEFAQNLQNAQQQAQKAEEQSNVLKSIIDQLRKEIGNLQLELYQTKQAKSEVDQNLKEQQSLVSDLNQQLADTKFILRAKENLVTQLSRQLKDQEAEHYQASNEVNQKFQTMIQKKDEVERSFRDQITNFQNRIDQLEEVRASLEQQLVD